MGSRDEVPLVRDKTPWWVEATAKELDLVRTGVTVFIPRAAGPESRDEWAGVVMGHWVLGPRAARVPKGARRRGAKLPGHPYTALSRCGAAAYIPEWQVLRGEVPDDCPLCRAGRKNPHMPAKLKIFWEEPYVASNIDAALAATATNLQGLEAPREWNMHAVPYIAGVLDRTSYGRAFGWRIDARNCIRQADRKGKALIRVRGTYPGQFRIELTVHPADSVYTYEVDLTYAKRTVPFEQVAAEVARAIDLAMGVTVPAAAPAQLAREALDAQTKAVGPVPTLFAPPKSGAAVVATPAPVTPVAPPVAGALDLEGLAKVHAGLTALLSVGKDMNAIAALEHGARDRLDRAEAALTATDAARREAAAVLHRLEANRAEVQDRVDLLDREVKKYQAQMAEAVKLRDAVAAQRAAAAAAVGAQEEAARPATAEVEAARKELAELAEMRANQLKTFGSPEALSDLFKALAKYKAP